MSENPTGSDDRDELSKDELAEREPDRPAVSFARGPGDRIAATATTTVETGLPWCSTCEAFSPPERDEDRTARCGICGTPVEWVEGEL